MVSIIKKVKKAYRKRRIGKRRMEKKRTKEKKILQKKSHIKGALLLTFNKVRLSSALQFSASIFLACFFVVAP